jgi:hypothetical protein
MRQGAFELFYEKFVPGQIATVLRLNEASDAIPPEPPSAEMRRFTEDFPAQRSRLGLLRRAPPGEGT